ncbi:trypsin-like peptidase domain-containing protein [Opitutia bacterium ISCC 51]|nr:trypsin-like peptidase domain-containing protein [Opitutae bacterium ISCC 51]QXD26603.1 trypsin-like peptidase domain-containing protein [Opitutae bacterium ISCC 52]
MRRLFITFLAILLGSLIPGHAELVILELSEGYSIKGEILQKKRDTYYVDLGYDIVQIPESSVLQVIDVRGETEITEMNTGQLFIESGIDSTQSVTELVSEYGEGVVLIETATGLGSGFFIHEDGYLITNEHVISGDVELKVTVFEEGESDGKELSRTLYEDVEIIAVSQEWDLALIKINDSEKSFKALPIGSGGELDQGQRVFALGSPLGFERSVSEGIVSLKNRVMQGRLLIQTTAEINPGNSGGPLLNLYGEVVGVNNLKIVAFGAEGLGFAIPAEMVKLFIDNRDAFAFDPRNPNNGFRYNKPPNASVTLDEDN